MQKGYRKIPVTRKGRFAGIVTATDVLNYAAAGEKHAVFLEKKQPLLEPVSSIMSERVVTLDARTTLKEAAHTFQNIGRGSYPVIERGRVVGMMADWDFVKRIRGTIGVAVGDIMVRRPAHAKESYPLLDVAKMMVKGGYRRLPVTKWNILSGIAVPMDILSLLPATVQIKEKRTIASLMKKNPVTVSPDNDLGEAISLMLKNNVGGLPVVLDEELVGIITESDIVHGMV